MLALTVVLSDAPVSGAGAGRAQIPPKPGSLFSRHVAQLCEKKSGRRVDPQAMFVQMSGNHEFDAGEGQELPTDGVGLFGPLALDLTLLPRVSIILDVLASRDCQRWLTAVKKSLK